MNKVLCGDFQGISLSLLGFGMMRLPTLPDGRIDEPLVFSMVDEAIANGVNYFDTAYPYHAGYSELVAGKALARYPRESYYLATKFPGHQVAKIYNPAEIFQEQLQKCGVDYFDFYLLHNINEGTIKNYTDSRWNILPYFIEQKKLGRIKHLGFSCHGGIENLKEFLAYAGDAMEFCQIQLNYLDWTLQDARQKCEILAAAKIPIWVMEPVRGGKLANLSAKNEEMLKALRPEESIASWALRYVQSIPNVKMILSGMSNMAQMQDNIKTFSQGKPLSEDEIAILYNIAEGMKDTLPCTTCRYCCDGCPAGLNIPHLIDIYNNYRVAPSMNQNARLLGIDKAHWPDACVGCGHCVKACPQKIDIPTAMRDFSERIINGPDWETISRARAKEAEELRKEQRICTE